MILMVLEFKFIATKKKRKSINLLQVISFLNNLNGKVDVVVMSAEIAADRAAKLILNIERINKDAKILVIADEFTLKPVSSENVADKVFSLLVRTQQQTSI
jgi:hypothetical protein